MSILIRGMEMPKGCASCFLKYGRCSSIRKRMDESRGDRWCPENYRHPDCPLIEVPQHGDLIDRDALLNGEGRYFISVCREGIDVAEIQKAPTVIPADKDGET